MATLQLGVGSLRARPAAELCALWDRTAPLDLARGAHLYLPGDPAVRVYLIRFGYMRIGRLAESGVELALDVAGPGEIVGQDAVLGEAQRSHLVQALSAVRVSPLAATTLEAALAQAPALALAFARRAAERSRRVEARAAVNLLGDCRRRLGRLLLELAERFGSEQPGGQRIGARLTHEDLARLIGAARETVTPILCQWRAAGLIDYDRRAIVVRKLRAL